MSRRLFVVGKDGDVVGPRQFYARIAGRNGVKPRLAKKALKLIDISENAWREALAMKDMILYSPHTFADWNKQRKKIEKLRAHFWTRRSFSKGLKEAYAASVEFYHYRASQGMT